MQRAVHIVNKFFPKVTSVVDAKRAVTINVQARDIRGSKKKSHHACAMARACQRSLPIDGAIISRSRAYLVKGRKATRYQVPVAISREITSFDRGAAFMPGAYILTKVTPSHTQNADRRRKKNQGTNTGTHVAARNHVTEGIRVSALSL